MPIAVFPKCFLDAILFEKTMTLGEWVELASSLPHVSGVETYFPTLESTDAKYLRGLREHHANCGLEMPMMCYSPDFTQPEAADRAREVEKQKVAIEATALLGGQFCRVLSGQKRPEVSAEDGISYTVECIEACLEFARERGVTLVLENHYKDPLWLHPEFAQSKEMFGAVLERIDHPSFGVNYDPSNALIAGDDPLEVLDLCAPKLRTMHASDRALKGGTLEDLKRIDADPLHGYASIVQHGVIGRGLIPYDAIFARLKELGFNGWMSIEDGQDPDVGIEHLRESAQFLATRASEHGLWSHN
jgi:sugar phosphate isomerase/epimerase